MVENKKCKGQNKAKSFDGCGTLVPANSRKQGLCGSCYKQWLLTTPTGKEYLTKVTIKAKVTVEKEKRKLSREEKLAETDYKYKLQEKVNEIARLIDNGLGCLATGYHAKQMHGGHIFSRGAEAPMRFNLHNIHRQSSQSNYKQSDDILLRAKLVVEYGQEYFDFLNSLRQGDVLKYSNVEYRSFYKKACALSNDIRREGKRYGWKERVDMRNWVNCELGIYTKEQSIFEL